MNSTQLMSKFFLTNFCLYNWVVLFFAEEHKLATWFIYGNGEFGKSLFMSETSDSILQTSIFCNQDTLDGAY